MPKNLTSQERTGLQVAIIVATNKIIVDHTVGHIQSPEAYVFRYRNIVKELFTEMLNTVSERLLPSEEADEFIRDYMLPKKRAEWNQASSTVVEEMFEEDEDVAFFIAMTCSLEDFDNAQDHSYIVFKKDGGCDIQPTGYGKKITALIGISPLEAFIGALQLSADAFRLYLRNVADHA